MYKVNKYQIDMKINSAEVSFNTFKIAGSNDIKPGSSDANFNITYTSSNTLAVTYVMSKGSFSHTATMYSSTVFQSNNIGSTALPTESDLTSMTNDIASATLPFILPVSGPSDGLWTTLDTVTFKDGSVNLNQNGVSLSGYVKSNITSDRFEVNVDVKESGSVGSENVNMKVGANIVYDLATGVLLGYKSSISLDATLSGNTYHEKVNTEITRQDFHFSGTGLFGFDTLSMIFSMFIISTIILKVRKNKLIK